MNENICKYCRWWEKNKNNLRDLRKGYDSDQAFLGFCRRSLPKAVQYTSDENEIAAGNPQCQHYAHWPETKEIDWCGEFQPK